MEINYEISITTRWNTRRFETWTWYGRMLDGNKVLKNLKLYATDAYLLLNESDAVVGGYDYIICNPEVTAKQIDAQGELHEK